MSSVVYNREPMALVNTMDAYFKARPPDYSIFSKDNCEISLHKELLYQTSFMCSLVKSANLDSCCKIEIICPSLQKEDWRRFGLSFC